jgi:hypothetical protein
METIRNTLAALTAVTEEGHDVAGAITIGVLCAVLVLVWAAAEGLLARGRRTYRDQTAIARTVGVLREQHTTAYDGEFADQIEQQLAGRRWNDRGDAS